ncbi:MAG: hydrolase, partial [Candidatus Bathyarchaeota archaeon]|nr:hydrolase [Candidatus Bathyarchaeota archaeon]
MPFTPYHLGPGLLFGLLCVSVIDFPTFLVANCIVDVEPLLVMAFKLDYPLHGFFHSLIGGTLVALALALVMTKIRDKLTPLMSFFKIEQKVSSKRIFAAALSGVYFHIL